MDEEVFVAKLKSLIDQLGAEALGHVLKISWGKLKRRTLGIRTLTKKQEQAVARHYDAFLANRISMRLSEYRKKMGETG